MPLEVPDGDVKSGQITATIVQGGHGFEVAHVFAFHGDMLQDQGIYAMRYSHPEQIMQEIAALTPTFHGVTYAKIERLGSLQWPCNQETGEAGTEIMHVDHFVRGKGRFIITQYAPTYEKVTRKFPLLMTT